MSSDLAGLPPEGQIVVIILALLLFITGYGLYIAFGPPNKKLTDPWDEHDD
jgi:PsbN protein